ncbi:MAG: 3-phosphoshikimate 1-carboxyvinyltransferase [Anaerotruncus massiliensis (ex Togo et al. 2019)]
MPVAAAYGLRATFVGRGRLPERPLGALADQMKAHGVSFSAGAMPFTIGGRLSPGRYELPGNVSSQFVTGLLFALPLLDGESEIVLTSPLQSAGYVEMTLRTLQESGVAVTPTENGWRVPGNQRFRAFDRTVEGDWSNAAFWLCAAAIGGTVRITGLSNDSAQGDRTVYEILERFGADITRDAHAVCCEAAPARQRIDAGRFRPRAVLAVTVAFAGDTGSITPPACASGERPLASTAALLRARRLGGGIP